MKYIPIKKKENSKRKIFIEEGIRISLPKPKFPRIMFWNPHKVEKIYQGWN